MLLLINNLVASYLRHTKLEVSPNPGRFPKHKRISPMQTLSEQPLFTHKHEEYELWEVGSSEKKKKTVFKAEVRNIVQLGFHHFGK